MTWDTVTIGALSLLICAVITAAGTQAERIIRALKDQTDVIERGNYEVALVNNAKLIQGAALITASGGTPPPVVLAPLPPPPVVLATTSPAPADIARGIAAAVTEPIGTGALAWPTNAELAHRVAVLEAAVLIPPAR